MRVLLVEAGFAMVMDLITRLKAVLVELKAEGNVELAARVEQAIRDLERGQQIPRPAGIPVSKANEHRPR